VGTTRDTIVNIHLAKRVIAIEASLLVNFTTGFKTLEGQTMRANAEKIANLFEYIAALIVFSLLLVLTALVIFYINASHYDGWMASIVPVVLVLLGLLIIYYDIKLRDKAKRAIINKKRSGLR